MLERLDFESIRWDHSRTTTVISPLTLTLTTSTTTTAGHDDDTVMATMKQHGWPVPVRYDFDGDMAMAMTTWRDDVVPQQWWQGDTTGQCQHGTTTTTTARHGWPRASTVWPRNDLTSQAVQYHKFNNKELMRSSRPTIRLHLPPTTLTMTISTTTADGDGSTHTITSADDHTNVVMSQQLLTTTATTTQPVHDDQLKLTMMTPYHQYQQWHYSLTWGVPPFNTVGVYYKGKERIVEPLNRGLLLHFVVLPFTHCSLS